MKEIEIWSNFWPKLDKFWLNKPAMLGSLGNVLKTKCQTVNIKKSVITRSKGTKEVDFGPFVVIFT